MRTSLMCVALSLLFAAGAAGGNLVTNGGFETGNFTGWTVTGENGYYGITDVVPHSGSYAAWFGQPSGMTYISQVLSTTPGATYGASFWIANNNQGQPSQNEFQVFWNGAEVLDATNAPSIPWTEVQGTLTATGTQTEIEFAFNNGPGWWNLDDVSVSTPEPQAVFFCGAGLAVIGMLRRRWRHRRV